MWRACGVLQILQLRQVEKGYFERVREEDSLSRWTEGSRDKPRWGVVLAGGLVLGQIHPLL